MSRLEITKVNPDSISLLSNLMVKVDGVSIEDVESVEFWVRRGGIARVAITFTPTDIEICADALAILKTFIDKEVKGDVDGEAVRGAEEVSVSDSDDSGEG
jgi:hypothetical protein